MNQDLTLYFRGREFDPFVSSAHVDRAYSDPTAQTKAEIGNNDRPRPLSRKARVGIVNVGMKRFTGVGVDPRDVSLVLLKRSDEIELALSSHFD
ncbi:MAG: hypothetical protein M3N53_13100 [Actinomycetota bacterium]|nr:hypothetical protein [Actinomycetota bacterium]